MLTNFSNEYSKRSDDELLLLACDRASLTTEAAEALDSELHHRNLTEPDRVKYQRFVKRNEHRNAMRRHGKIYGTRTDRSSWVELFMAFTAMALISVVYLVLPIRFRMRGDWEEAAVAVMFASVFIAVFFAGLWWRRVSFWMSLAISSAIHLIAVHAWIQRVGKISGSVGRLAILLGFALFFAIYGLVWVARRNLYGGESP